MSGDTLSSVEWPRRGLTPAEFAAMGCNAPSFTSTMKTTEQLIEEAISTGGAIITSDSCHPAEIAIARAQGRFAQHGDFGLILKPARWVKAAQDAHNARMNGTA
jgi:hypothetical protein